MKLLNKNQQISVCYLELKYYNISTLLIFALNLTKPNLYSEGSKGLEESAIGSFSLIVLALNLGGLGGGVLVDELESVLILTLNELILLPGNSVLVGLQVGIRGGLSSGGGSKVSVGSGRDESLGNIVISGFEGSIKSGLLGLNGSGIGGLSLLEALSVLVVSTSEGSGSGGL